MVTTKYIKNRDTLKNVQRAMLQRGLHGMTIKTDEEGSHSVVGWIAGSPDEFRKEVEERFDVKVVV
jgi:hypothetical protein